jgi:thiol-disulfide isomerase/thioredoxin
MLLLFFSCTNQVKKEYVSISGKILNNKAKNIDLLTKGYDKRIKVRADGTFKDTIKVIKSGFFTFKDGKNSSYIHLKNGDDIEMTYDYDDYINTVQFKGKGFGTSKYLAERKKLDIKENFIDIKSYFKLNSKEFITKLNRVEKEIDELLKIKGIDSVLLKNELSRKSKTIAYLKKNYAREHEFFTKFAKGKESPKFYNYEKFGGGKASLDDFKGKYVYIDVWATWCGPCKREIPHLKSLYEDYKDKNIEFISISVDNGRGHQNDPVKAKIAWKEMIKSKDTKWMQLYADKAWSSDFIKAYGIRSIPRFILIDNKGNIIDANAPRPSNKGLRKVLDKLLK